MSEKLSTALFPSVPDRVVLHNNKRLLFIRGLLLLLWVFKGNRPGKGENVSFLLWRKGCWKTRRFSKEERSDDVSIPLGATNKEQCLFAVLFCIRKGPARPVLGKRVSLNGRTILWFLARLRRRWGCVSPCEDTNKPPLDMW